jgi:hypothetical protein
MYVVYRMHVHDHLLCRGTRRSPADRFPNGLAYVDDDEARRSNHWRVIYRMRPHLGVHPLRHKPLRVRDDHAVLLRDEKPTREISPEWTIHRHLLFCADADLRVIVEKRDEIDIEGRFGRRADFVDDGAEGFGGRQAHTHCSDPAAGADSESEVGSAASKGHARTGERMAAAEALRHPR